MIALIVALALGLAPFQAPQQLDLICSGKYRNSVNGKWKPLQLRYRLDMAAGSWCVEDCTILMKIVRAEPGKIVLQESDPADHASGYVSSWIDRISGSYRRLSTGGGLGLYREEEGSCEAAVFSGFPATKF